ncbi:MAG: immunoglobulin-like domain-containing protein, partial [Bombilactobacillus sp.]
SSIKSNTVDGALGATNGNVAITDANGNVFENGSLTSNKFIDYSKTDKVPATASTTTTTAGASSSLTSFAADQIFANGAPATYKLKVQITDGSSVPESGAPVIAFTEGGQNLKIAKGGTFDQFKGLQFYAYPGAKAWDQKDDSVKVSVSGKVNTNVEGTYTLVYTVTNKAGKTSTLTRVITVGSGVEKPTEYDFNLSEAYIDYVPGYNVREYSYPGNDWTGNQVKHGTDVKVTKRAVFQNGEEWYKLGDGNWVKSQYVKAGKNPSDAVDARGVVTVNYIPGYGIAVYKEAGKPELVRVNGKAKRLPHGTAWKSFKKQKVNGITYYNVGGNQWVDGRYVDFK